MTCFPTKCGESASPIDANNITACSTLCSNSATCKMFGFSVDDSTARCHLVNDYNCDFQASAANQYLNRFTCINGPISKEIFENDDSDLKKLMDEETDNTCVDVQSEKALNLRIPWPSIDLNSLGVKDRIVE